MRIWNILSPLSVYTLQHKKPHTFLQFVLQLKSHLSDLITHIFIIYLFWWSDNNYFLQGILQIIYKLIQN